jgi:putative phosphoribosyl transferase
MERRKQRVMLTTGGYFCCEKERACMKTLKFRNRVEAGRLLAARLTTYTDRPDVLILILPRGGIQVGYEIAKALHAPLDVIIVRKLGVPGQEELAMGALASGGIRVMNEDIVWRLGIPEDVIHEVAEHEQREIERREHLYRGNRNAYEVRDRTVILVDDGIATGATMRAAIKAVRQQRPRRLIVALPVAPSETYEALAKEVDELVCIRQPEEFLAVGFWYENFLQVTDQEVCSLLQQATRERTARP